jgi:NAD(P)-dependent dehydrogenase (short-subunit alcohol dehydrogenase family)
MSYLLDYPLEDFRCVINTNLIASILLIKKLLPPMPENGSCIINVTSTAGAIGYKGMSQTWGAELVSLKN